eukprot:scaffold18641_cov23-Tisochrysis_lutea.AAC.1
MDVLLVGDVLLHTVTDALLGALNLPDIGELVLPSTLSSYLISMLDKGVLLCICSLLSLAVQWQAPAPAVPSFLLTCTTA